MKDYKYFIDIIADEFGFNFICSYSARTKKYRVTCKDLRASWDFETKTEMEIWCNKNIHK